MTDAIPSWTICSLSRRELKQLSRRSDRAGLIHYGAFFALLIALGTATVLTWGTLWVVPALFLYATVYGFAGSRLHECHHGTPFRTHALNEVLHQLFGIMAIKEAVRDRWMHTQHHTYTYFTARDPEIQSKRPPDLLYMAVDIFRIPNSTRFFWLALRNATGKLDPEARAIAPADVHGQIVASSRRFIAAYVLIAAGAVALQSWLPLVLTMGARFVGAWGQTVVGITQHAGMPENTTDHRANTRTMYLSPLLRFLYVNMNYHIEHHMYPMVPFHALPALHQRIKAETPPAYPGLWPALREVLTTLLRQRREPTYSVARPVAVPAAGEAAAPA